MAKTFTPRLNLRELNLARQYANMGVDELREDPDVHEISPEVASQAVVYICADIWKCLDGDQAVDRKLDWWARNTRIAKSGCLYERYYTRSDCRLHGALADAVTRNKIALLRLLRIQELIAAGAATAGAVADSEYLFPINMAYFDCAAYPLRGGHIVSQLENTPANQAEILTTRVQQPWVVPQWTDDELLALVGRRYFTACDAARKRLVATPPFASGDLRCLVRDWLGAPDGPTPRLDDPSHYVSHPGPVYSPMQMRVACVVVNHRMSLASALAPQHALLYKHRSARQTRNVTA